MATEANMPQAPFSWAPADLAADSAVHRLEAAPGWYTADLPAHWNFLTPSGGVLMTCALRAMAAELGDPELRVVSATTLFCSPVPEGPLEIRVEVLRRGKSASQVRAALSSTRLPGPGLEVSATFARERGGIDMTGVQFPDVPMPDNCPLMLDDATKNPHPRAPFFANVDSRLALGARWWHPGWQAGPPRFARWFRYLVPQRRADPRWFDPLALPPIADTMPPSLLMALGPDADPFYAPSLDLTVHFVEETTDDWLLVSTWARRARGGVCTVEAEIWSASKRLVAYATQVMYLTSGKRKKP
jgi:acyl-CoA thioesterase